MSLADCTRATAAAAAAAAGVARGGVPTLQGIEEEGTEAAMSSRQASDTGRQYGSGGAAAASLWASHAVAEEAEAEEAPEVAEEESTSEAGGRAYPDPAQQQEREGQWGAGLPAEASRASSSRQRGAGQGDGEEQEQEQGREVFYGARDQDAEEVPEDGEVDEEQEGEGQEDGHSAAGRRSDAGSRFGGASGDLSRAQRSEAYDDAGAGSRAGSRTGGWGNEAGGGAGGGSTSHRSYQQSAAASGSMAMRGFVEPLTYDNSYNGAGAVQAERSSADGRSQRGAAKDEEDEDKGQQEDDGYGEDSFEEEVPEDNEESEEPEDRQPAAAASEASYGGRQPDRPTSSLSAVRPLSRTGHAASPEEQEEEDDRELFACAAAAAAVRRPAAGGTTTPPPAPPPAPELLPPQEFAMQLLKHDIEVLPAHHRAAAEVAGKGRRPTSARPVGAGLAAFGYLGFHVPPDTLTAPTGPAYRTSANGSSGQRTSSPGRGNSNSGQEGYPGAGVNLAGGPSLTTVRPDGATAAGEGEQGTTSAPHVRPDGGAGGSPGATVATEMSNSQFLGAARELRAGKPPARPASAVRGTGRHSTGGGAQASASATPRDLGALLEDKSMSVLGDEEASAANNRIKFDVWLDALSGKAAEQQQQQTSEGGASATSAASRRSSRPMTAPASGRRRPVSARPAPASGALNSAVYGTPHTAVVPRPLARPMSAQPHHMRPVSASRSGHVAPVYDTSGLLPEATVPVTIHPHGSPMSAAGGGTAAVDVAGVTVSVYVADTLKRIVEANRWLQQLGVTAKRYRLKDRLSNMTVQLVEEVPVPSYGREDEDSTNGQGEDGSGNGHYATVLTVLKELTLKQFLSGHARLKQQVRALRLASTPPLPGGGTPPPTGGSLGLSVAGGAHGISMSGGQGAGTGAGRTRPYSAGPGGSRSRPASASAAHYGSAGGAAALADGPFVGTAAAVPHPTGGLRSVYPGPTPARTSLPARPSSANPAYGRTPIMYGGGAPPGGPPAPGTYSAAAASYGNSRAGQPQGPQHHTVPTTLPAKSAWGTAPTTNGANGAPLPYMVRSVSAHARSGGHVSAPGATAYFEEDEDEEVVVEADPMADVTRSVRSQLGSAAEYCQARRAEIARLRNMPLA